MKTLHLSIIIGISIIAMTSFGVFIEKINDYQQKPYIIMMIDGMKENYTVNDPVSFSVTLEGYGTGCGDTKATITKENDSKYQSPGWASQPQCVANPSLHSFKFNALSTNTIINETGNYVLTVSFDDLFEHQKTLVKKFSVVLPNASIHNTGMTLHDVQGLPEDCGKFHTVPENKTSLNTVPVLLMKSNSTACARLTFTISSNYNDCNGSNCQHIFSLASMLYIRNLHYEKNDGSFSITPGKDYTNSFKIIVAPDAVDLANYPLGTNFTATYIISPLPNATGFYDQSIPRPVCERYPLVVGYTKDQVNSSDFSRIDPLGSTCVSSTSMLTKVE